MIEISCIVCVFETRTEIEDSIMSPVPSRQEFANGVPVIAVQRLDATSGKAADDNAVGDVAQVQLYALVGHES